MTEQTSPTLIADAHAHALAALWCDQEAERARRTAAEAGRAATDLETEMAAARKAGACIADVESIMEQLETLTARAQEAGEAAHRAQLEAHKRATAAIGLWREHGGISLHEAEWRALSCARSAYQHANITYHWSSLCHETLLAVTAEARATAALNPDS